MDVILELREKARQDGSVSSLFVIDDTDATGGIPYLPSGAA